MSTDQKSGYEAFSAGQESKSQDQSDDIKSKSSQQPVAGCSYLAGDHMKSETSRKKMLKIENMSTKQTSSTAYSKRSHTLVDSYKKGHYPSIAASVKTKELPMSPHPFTTTDYMINKRNLRNVSILSKQDSSKVFPKPRRNIDMSKIPKVLRNLHRSPNNQDPNCYAWTSSVNGTSMEGGLKNPSGIILTDIALNQTPDLVLSTSSVSQKYSAKPSLFPFRRQVIKNLEVATNGEFYHMKDKLESNNILPISSWDRRTEPFLNKSSSKAKIDDDLLNHVIHLNKHKQLEPVELDQSRNISETQASIIDELDILKPWMQGIEEQSKLYSNDGIHTNWTILDLQREKERQELLPSRYVDDIKVLHNIHRREMVSKLLYREEGQLLYRRGPTRDPHPPLPKMYLLSGPTPGPPLKRNVKLEPLVTDQEARKVFDKVKESHPTIGRRMLNDMMWSPEGSTFISSCLNAHNLYRYRHSAELLTVSKKLCYSAQNWANYLAQTGCLKYCNDPKTGENLFCRNVSLVIRTSKETPDISGDEVTAYWYSDVRNYRFNLSNSALQAHAGSFTQMVWAATKEIGLGKSLSREGTLIVVAHYYPPGNITGKFRSNVLSLNIKSLAVEMMQMGETSENVFNAQKDLAVVSNSVSGVLAAQPPNITGRNATKIMAAHMIGLSASVVTTADEKLEVVILPGTKNKKRTIRKADLPKTETIQTASRAPDRDKVGKQISLIEKLRTSGTKWRMSASSNRRGGERGTTSPLPSTSSDRRGVARCNTLASKSTSDQPHSSINVPLVRLPTTKEFQLEESRPLVEPISIAARSTNTHPLQHSSSHFPATNDSTHTILKCKIRQISDKRSSDSITSEYSGASNSIEQRNCCSFRNYDNFTTHTKPVLGLT